VAADSPLTRPGDPRRRRDRELARALTPLRRKPKTLTEEPALLDVSRPAGPGGQVPGGGETRDRSGKPSTATQGSGTAAGDEQAGILPSPAAASAAADAETLRRAREIAARLALRRPRREAAARRGAAGTLASVPYRGGADDIDLDQTLARLAERGMVAADDDIVVRERVATRRCVVLLVDVSGSMRGERVRTAAATVGALAAELARDHLAVVAFWSDAAVLARLGTPVAADRLLESMVRIPARGLTNVAFPLQVAARELARVPARDARAVLLSDCVHNAGPDPRPFAARLPRLDVLLDVTGEQDRWLGGELARLGRGKLRVAGTYRDVAPALSSFFAD
jgi:Mg-chelatase subunit ChlD